MLLVQDILNSISICNNLLLMCGQKWSRPEVKQAPVPPSGKPLLQLKPRTTKCLPP